MLPEVVGWFLGGWLVASLVLAAVLSRWLRDRYEGSTPWETSVTDPDVEVRWRNGKVESRLVR
jgi:hypothetical protein